MNIKFFFPHLVLTLGLVEVSSLTPIANLPIHQTLQGTSSQHYAFKSTDFFVDGPPLDTKPNYEEIHGPLGANIDKFMLIIFRAKMTEQVGEDFDSKLPRDDYGGLMELASTMNSMNSIAEVETLSLNVLKSLFPSWLPEKFSWMFAAPFPAFSARMNAWATRVAGTWLMGDCEINDCDIDGGGVGKNQGLLVKRCRFLEESGCASVCVNSCKIPTQNFFIQEMGLPLTMEPDYDTGECQFSFGLTPSLEAEMQAKATPCLSRCPSSGALRKQHLDEISRNSGCSSATAKKCFMMED